MSVKSFKTSGVGVDLAPKGLVLINTTSFSGVSSISLPAATFSATYLNYRIFLQMDTTAASSELDVRMRASGADNSSSNYAWARYGAVGSTGGFTGSSSQTTLDNKWRTSAVSGTFPAFQVLDIFSPFSTDFNAGFSANGIYVDAIASNWTPITATGILSVNTSYDSMTFYGPTMTGVYSVYGYNK